MEVLIEVFSLISDSTTFWSILIEAFLIIPTVWHCRHFFPFWPPPLLWGQQWQAVKQGCGAKLWLCAWVWIRTGIWEHTLNEIYGNCFSFLFLRGHYYERWSSSRALMFVEIIIMFLRFLMFRMLGQERCEQDVYNIYIALCSWGHNRLLQLL